MSGTQIAQFQHPIIPLPCCLWAKRAHGGAHPSFSIAPNRCRAGSASSGCFLGFKKVKDCSPPSSPTFTYLCMELLFSTADPHASWILSAAMHLQVLRAVVEVYLESNIARVDDDQGLLHPSEMDLIGAIRHCLAPI